MNWWRTEKAAGDGSARGRTGRLRVFPDCDDGGSVGSEAQCEARTSECTGKISRVSLLAPFDAVDEMARACVG